ncbi:hypothetical protein D3C73_694240 [compost metagenome]
MGYHIIVNLLEDRTKLGTLKVYASDGTLKFGPVQALGRSADNIDWDQTNGHTPSGVYDAVVVAAGSSEYSYGPYKRVSLDPVSGNALIAENNGRTGLMIHGGDPASTGAVSYPLRPTYGCVRLSNANQKTLIQTIADLGGGKGKVTVNVN